MQGRAAATPACADPDSHGLVRVGPHLHADPPPSLPDAGRGGTFRAPSQESEAWFGTRIPMPALSSSSPALHFLRTLRACLLGDQQTMERIVRPGNNAHPTGNLSMGRLRW